MMGQSEVWGWFKNYSDCKSYSIREITNNMNQVLKCKTQVFSVWRSVIKLYEKGYLIMIPARIKAPIKYKINNVYNK